MNPTTRHGCARLRSTMPLGNFREATASLGMKGWDSRILKAARLTMLASFLSDHAD